MNAPPLALRTNHCLADLLRAFALSRDLLDDSDVRQFLIEKGRMGPMLAAENAAHTVTRPREADDDARPPALLNAVAYGRVNSYTKHSEESKGDRLTVQLGLHQAMEGDVDLMFHAAVRGKFEPLFGKFVKVSVSLIEQWPQDEMITFVLAEADRQGVP